jgi:type VI secretion system secreted protein VgrG
MAEPISSSMTLRWSGPATAHVVHLAGREALNELFRFDVDILVPAEAGIVIEELLGSEATVHVQPFRDLGRYFGGMIASLRRGSTTHGLTRWRLGLVPTLWRLTRRSRSRMFQQQTVPEILRAVLHDVPIEDQLGAAYAPRNYCVQYRETDFAFICRLMEEEGIRFTFRHGPDGHQMVISDGTTYANVDGPNPVRWDATRGGTRDTPRIRSWSRVQEIGSTGCTLWDHHFQLPDQHLQATEAVAEAVRMGGVPHQLRGSFNAELEVFDGLARRAADFDGVAPDGREQPEELKRIYEQAERQAELIAQAEACAHLQAHGVSDAIHFVAGVVFDLAGRPPTDGTYLLCQVEHEATQAPPHSESKDLGVRYENRFTTLPTTLPYRPARRTPKATIAGTRTATVEGPAGQATHLDRFGRIQVRFPWDGEDRASCWVRVAQPWAGKRYGAFFWPRVGHEVVIAFEEGDPDRPIALGSLYNTKTPPPFDLPGNELISGVKSAGTTPEALADYNSLLLHDQPGQEHVHLHSQKEETSNSEATRFQHVGQQQSVMVGALPASPPAAEPRSKGWRQHVSATTNDMAPSLGNNLDFTIGDAVHSVLGLAGQNVVGHETNLYFNPLSYLSLGMPASGIGLGAGAMAGLGAALGRTRLSVGSDNTLIHGPFTEVQRGGRPMQITEGFHPGYTALATLVSGLAMAANIGVGLDPSNPVGWDIGANILKTAALTLLSGIEAINALAKVARTESELAKMQAEAAQSVHRAQVALELAREAEANATAALKTVLQAVHFVGERKAEGAAVEMVTGSYVLHASSFASFTADDTMCLWAKQAIAASAGEFITFCNDSTALVHLNKGSEVEGSMALFTRKDASATLTLRTDYFSLDATTAPYVRIEDDSLEVFHGTKKVNASSVVVSQQNIWLTKEQPAGRNFVNLSDDGCLLAADSGATGFLKLTKEGISLRGANIELAADVSITIDAGLIESNFNLSTEDIKLMQRN